jgi:hypothetical protein
VVLATGVAAEVVLLVAVDRVEDLVACARQGFTRGGDRGKRPTRHLQKMSTVFGNSFRRESATACVFV